MKLVIDQLTISYPRAAETVRPVANFDLTVDPGELILLHGPSGCGKTSLLSAIGGLLTPESGSIRLGGSDITALRGRAMLAHRRNQIGIVFQSFNLLPSLTAEENVAVPLALSGIAPHAARTRARALLDELGMGHRRSHRPDALSGGQQQRVAIARALATDPPVLLADEPTAHLDRTQVDIVRGMLRTIADAGRIVIVSTHDDRLTSVAHRIVPMKNQSVASIRRDTEPHPDRARRRPRQHTFGSSVGHAVVPTRS